MYRTITFWGAILLLAVSAFADAPSVFLRAATPDDRRLSDVRDVDHPVPFTPDFKDKADWLARARALREQVLVAEGLWPLPPRLPLQPVIHGTIDRDGYTIEKVFFASYPGHYVSGNLYRPKNRPGRLPAVLSPHGHWPDGRLYERTDAEARKQISQGGETTMAGAKYPMQARCAMLARMGCVVFQYDMVGYADSTAIRHGAGFTDAQAVLRLQSFMGLQTWNSIRALDFLQSLPDVDPARIAVTGASGGATQTLLLCAVDDRPAVAFPAVMVSESMQGGCPCENAPLLRVDTNNVELAALFAPKPLGMTAANDWTRDLETKGLPKLKTIYGLFGAADQVMGKYFPFEHNYNQVSRELMYNWMNDHLKLGWSSPVKEKPFDPVPPGELSVYDDAHPRPADTCDATALRKYMTQTSDRQIEDIWKADPSEYRRIVGTALRVMVDDRLPAGSDVVVRHASGPQMRDDVIIETGALSRRGAGEAVPYVLLMPPVWSGSVVVWVHSDGKSNLFDKGGKPTSDVRRLLDRKMAVVCADLFLTGEYNTKDKPASKPGNGDNAKPPYAGYVYGYNRGVLANRVHDLLTELAFVRQWKGTRAVNIVAFGRCGPAALLARALAGDAVDRCSIDLAGFDFDQVDDPYDPMMLPGALKYGGICGFVPLCDSGRTLLTGVKKSPTFDRAASTKQLILKSDSLSSNELLDWLLSSQ